MPSNRKQKARGKRSRQSDVRSDIEYLDVLLGNYFRSQLSENEGNMDLMSDGSIPTPAGRILGLF